MSALRHFLSLPEFSDRKHLLDENPRLFFMHFWANDDAVTLARGLKAALDLTNSKR